MRIFTFAILGAAALIAAGEAANRRAPGFALPDSKFEIFDLADFRGKVVVLEFMQTTCPHCAAFAPILNEVQQKYGDKVAILAVVNSGLDNQDTVAQYVAGHKARYPILFDAGQMALSYLRSPKMEFPHAYLIDGGGTIRADFGYGPMTKEVFEGRELFNEIDKLLAGSGSGAKKK